MSLQLGMREKSDRALARRLLARDLVEVPAGSLLRVRDGNRTFTMIVCSNIPVPRPYLMSPEDSVFISLAPLAPDGGRTESCRHSSKGATPKHWVAWFDDVRPDTTHR